MPILDDASIFKQIKQGDICPQYLLYGQEAYFISSAVERIIQKAVPKGFEAFNVIRISGEKLDLNELEDAVATFPLMTGKKCVLLKDLDIDKLAKADFDRLVKLVKDPNEASVLIIYTTDNIYDSKKSTKLRKLIEIISKNGSVCDFGTKDKSTLKRALCDRAKKAGIELTAQIAEMIIDCCSQDYSILINELDKLISYADSRSDELRQITVQDVQLCCIPSVDSTSFDLAKAILAKKYDTAFRLLDELFYQRVEALSILGALNMCFIDLYRAKVALAHGKTVDMVTADFGYPKNRLFAVKNAFRDVRAYSIENLRKCLTALTEADYQLKSSKLQDRLILETMIGRMI